MKPFLPQNYQIRAALRARAFQKTANHCAIINHKQNRNIQALASHFQAAPNCAISCQNQQNHATLCKADFAVLHSFKIDNKIMTI